MTDIRAITVRQPWAWAIARGGKTVENRSRGTSYRGPLLIHAGKAWSDRGGHDQRVAEACVRTWPQPRPVNAAAVVAARGLDPTLYAEGLWSRGAVIAVAQLVDVHPDAGCCRPWGESSYAEGGGRIRTAVYHLVLEDVLPLAEPVPCRGELGLWRPPQNIVDAALDTDVDASILGTVRHG